MNCGWIRNKVSKKINFIVALLQYVRGLRVLQNIRSTLKTWKCLLYHFW